MVTHVKTAYELWRPCIVLYSNMTSFFRFANKRAIYLDDKLSLAHARCAHLSHVIKSQNKIIYTVVKVLQHLCSL